MRIHITLQMNGIHLPYSYQRGIQAFLYSSLNYDLAKEMHDSSLSGIIKPFVFSDLHGKHVIDDKGIIYTNTAFLDVASTKISFLNDVFNKLTSSSMIEICGNFIPVLEISGSQPPEYTGSVKYRTISPVTIYKTLENGYREYPSPADKSYAEMIRGNLSKKYEMTYGVPMTDYFNLYMPDNIQKRMRSYKHFQYICYDFTFKMDTTPAVHALAMNLGIGSRNSAGFGMIEPVR